MALDRLSHLLEDSLAELQARCSRKGAEHVVAGFKAAAGGNGPRCYLAGHGDRPFLRMNSNSYLGLSFHPRVIEAEEQAARLFGTGPGAVRFISGTCTPHVELENRLARFHGRPSAMIFSAAYAAMMGVLPPLITEETMVFSDDILVATLGKAFGVNGGYVVSDRSVIDYLRETSPFYVYSNPITPAEAAAAMQAIDLVDGEEGRDLLARMRRLTRRLQEGLTARGREIVAGDHPIVPLMIRDTEKTAALVRHLFAHNILATGLNYPVVPRGDEEIRFQISASHTQLDIDYVLAVLAVFAS